MITTGESKGSEKSAKIGTPVAVAVAAREHAETLAATLGQAGAARVVIAPDVSAAPSLGGTAVALLEKTVRDVVPLAVVVDNSPFSRLVAARVAARIGAAVAADVVDLEFEVDEVVASHSVFGGDWRTESAVEGGGMVVTLRYGVVDVRAEAPWARVQYV